MPNIGGLLQVDIFLSKDVLQQPLINSYSLQELVLLYAYNPIASFKHRHRLSGNFSKETTLVEYSWDTNENLSFVVEQDEDPQQVQSWLDRYKNSPVCIYFKNVNEFEYCFNPYFLSVKYLGANELTSRNRYEFSFVRSKILVDYVYSGVLGNASIKLKKDINGAGTTVNYFDVTVLPKLGCDLDLYNLYITQNSDYSNLKPITRNPKHYKEGTYYVLAQNKKNILVEDRKQIIVNTSTVTN